MCAYLTFGIFHLTNIGPIHFKPPTNFQDNSPFLRRVKGQNSDTFGKVPGSEGIQNFIPCFLVFPDFILLYKSFDVTFSPWTEIFSYTRIKS